MKSNVDIVVDELRSGPKTLAQLAGALLREGKHASRAIAGQSIRNARKKTYKGADIIAIGRGRYFLADCPPEGVRHKDGVWQIRSRTRWQDTPFNTAEEAAQLREQMKKGGVL